jgi:hypothetical protein
MRDTVPQDQSWRIASVALRLQVVSDVAIKKTLDAFRRRQFS